MQRTWIFAVFLLVCVASTGHAIEPYSQNNWYWQHDWGDGMKPVMLLGASSDDNPYMWAGANFDQNFINIIPKLHDVPVSGSNGDELLDAHLDLLESVGGNWIRNALFSRFRYGKIDDEGYDKDYQQIFPYVKLASGKYDLDQWNQDYFDRLEYFLEATKDRKIFVAMEFTDYEIWAKNPFNPDNNVNYSWDDNLTGLENIIKDFEGSLDRRNQEELWKSSPFWCVLDYDDSVVREHVERRYKKILDLTLQYDHLLYNLKNESSSPVEISDYWINFIQNYAQGKGKTIYITENRWLHPRRTYKEQYGINDHFRDMSHTEVNHSILNPSLYTYIDQSNISGEIGQTFYDSVIFLRNHVEAESVVRPINFLKNYRIHWYTCNANYGNEDPRNTDDNWTNNESAARMWRGVCAGVAAMRFHRDGHIYGCSEGVGLSTTGQTHLKSLRMFTDELNLFTMAPNNDLFVGDSRTDDEAHCIANPGVQYGVYFKGEKGDNSVQLDLSAVPASSQVTVQWLDIKNSQWESPTVTNGGGNYTLTVPESGYHWAVVLTAEDGSVPPNVSLTSPADGATFATGSDIIMTATASDADGTVTRVEFYNGATMLGEDISAPYAYTWESVAQGTYTVTARAYDNDGASTTSPGVGITVGAAPANLVRNPGFEDGSNHWAMSGSGVSVVNEGANGSNHSIRITANGGSRNANQTTLDSVVAGQPYTFEMWTRSENIVANGNYKPQASLRWRDASNGYIGDPVYLYGNQGTTSWQHKYTEITAPSGAVQARITVYTWSAVTSGNMFFDDVGLIGEGGEENEPPVVDSTSPASPFTMAEGTSTTFSVSASDPDGDGLNYSWLLDGVAVGGSAANHIYSPDFNAAGNHSLQVTVNDGNSGTAGHTWSISVTDEPPDEEIEYQAEDAQNSNGVQFGDGFSGWTGTGWQGWFGEVDDFVEWTAVNAGMGSKTLVFRYAHGGTSDASYDITVNGTLVAADVIFPVTGSWSTWNVVEVSATLASGNDTIRVESNGGGGVNLDRMDVTD